MSVSAIERLEQGLIGAICWNPALLALAAPLSPSEMPTQMGTVALASARLMAREGKEIGDLTLPAEMALRGCPKDTVSWVGAGTWDCVADEWWVKTAVRQLKEAAKGRKLRAG